MLREAIESVAPAGVNFRAGTPNDALCISVLAMQVFLDTYATNGLRDDLAREALIVYSPDAFAARLAQPTTYFLLAEKSGYLLGFAEVSFASPAPISEVIDGAELIRLYVQRPFKRMRIGGALLAQSETLALTQSAACLWLTAWSGNAPARSFYVALGYSDVGATTYVIEGSAFENRIYVKMLTQGHHQ